MVITTRAELDAEQALHPGETKYKLFSIDDGKQRIIEYYWSADKNAAYGRLTEYRSKTGREDAYFAPAYQYMHENGDGTVSVYDSLRENISKRVGDGDGDGETEETPYETARKEKEYMLRDFKFFVDNYDVESGSSHNRCESWSLDRHILSDLEFNIPKIIEDKSGIPSDFLAKGARVVSGKGKFESGDVQKYSGDALAHNAGKRLWDRQLNNILRHVWLYDFYSNFGIIDEQAPDAKKEYLNKFRIPKEGGMYDTVNYRKLDSLAQIQWRCIWLWMSKYGQSLWT